MADVVDDAQAISDRLHDARIQKLREQADKQTVKSTGRCLYCDEELQDGRRWCDADCRDIWEKQNR